MLKTQGKEIANDRQRQQQTANLPRHSRVSIPGSVLPRFVLCTVLHHALDRSYGPRLSPHVAAAMQENDRRDATTTSTTRRGETRRGTEEERQSGREIESETQNGAREKGQEDRVEAEGNGGPRRTRNR